MYRCIGMGVGVVHKQGVARNYCGESEGGVIASEGDGNADGEC